MNCWALGRRGSLSPGDTNDPPHEPRKQADQVLLLRILHIEDEILEGFLETRANREGFLDIANADTVCRNGKVKDDVCKSQVMKGGDAYMCEMPSSWSEVKFFETWKGPSRRPGRISWHWWRMSYLRLDSGSATDFWDTGAVRRTSTRHPRVPVSAHGVLEGWVRTWKCLGWDTGCCRVVGRNERRVDSEAVSKGVRDSNP